jgi:uncharacterized protein GlcG (DUF336 family)
MSLILAMAAVAISPVTQPTQTEAQRAVNAAIVACKGTPIAVAVLDYGGPRLVVVTDEANAIFGQFAIRKAATAMRFAKPSAAVRDEAKSNAALAETLKTDPALIGFGGGVPFTGGALAVAGAPSQDTDEMCARAGIAAMPRAALPAP